MLTCKIYRLNIFVVVVFLKLLSMKSHTLTGYSKKKQVYNTERNKWLYHHFHQWHHLVCWCWYRVSRLHSTFQTICYTVWCEDRVNCESHFLDLWVQVAHLLTPSRHRLQVLCHLVSSKHSSIMRTQYCEKGQAGESNPVLTRARFYKSDIPNPVAHY